MIEKSRRKEEVAKVRVVKVRMCQNDAEFGRSRRTKPQILKEL